MAADHASGTREETTLVEARRHRDRRRLARTRQVEVHLAVRMLHDLVERHHDLAAVDDALLDDDGGDLPRLGV